MAATVPAALVPSDGGTDVEGPTSSSDPGRLGGVEWDVVCSCHWISSHTVDLMVSSTVVNTLGTAVAPPVATAASTIPTGDGAEETTVAVRPGFDAAEAELVPADIDISLV